MTYDGYLQRLQHIKKQSERSDGQNGHELLAFMLPAHRQVVNLIPEVSPDEVDHLLLLVYDVVSMQQFLVIRQLDFDGRIE